MRSCPPNQDGHRASIGNFEKKQCAKLDGSLGGAAQIQRASN